MVGSIFIFVKLDPSHSVYLEAKSLYENGENRKAYVKVQEAMRINALNRKAILLQAKLHKIVTSEDNYNAAMESYSESMQNYFDEEYLLAIHNISESYDSLNKVHSDAPIFDKAKKLQAKVDEKIDSIQKKLPELYFKKIEELMKEKQYSAAYEYLLRMDSKDKKVISSKDKLAYKIGTERYAKVMSNTDNISDYEIADAIYWLSSVTKESSSFSFSEKQIKVLQTLLKQQEKE